VGFCVLSLDSHCFHCQLEFRRGQKQHQLWVHMTLSAPVPTSLTIADCIESGTAGESLLAFFLPVLATTCSPKQDEEKDACTAHVATEWKRGLRARGWAPDHHAALVPWPPGWEECASQGASPTGGAPQPHAPTHPSEASAVNQDKSHKGNCLLRP
jgi:hypothetical protein